ncbi:hypothetical protein RclHR1_01500019 [Rhizophagus clarus]|uniref:SOSS complex subunit B homolog n=1 Tax=Rhizophagus clarus TaxID=94130 RepID=A0A2Z6QRM9_9GLOM|nr:hypothetical protein RclHR1_01500019 [Rhizophagus clarus]GES72854.1 SOSS complex subunit B homolog [Rhizophagus clarus]
MSVNSLVETSASAPPPIIQHRYGNNNSIIQKPIPIQRNGVLKIRELRPWIRGFDITCIILEHLSRRTLKTQQEVELHSFLVADETAVCTLVIWENGQYYQGGDIVQITLGETRVHDESLELTVNKNFGKIKIVDWDTMYYKEDEEPNLSSYTWVQDEKNPNTYVPMNSEKKFIDLETFKPYERPPQPYTIDSMQPGGFSNIIKQEFQIKQDDPSKMIRNEDDGIYNNIPFSQRLRYGSNGGGNEQFMLQHDSRSPRPALPLQPQTMLQQNDRPRPPQRRNSKFPRRDSWRDQDGRQDRDNGRPRNQDGNKRPGGGGGRNQPRNRGRDWDRIRDNRDRDRDRDRDRGEWDFNRPPHTDLDRPAEEGELVNFYDFNAGLNGLIRPDNRDPREVIQHKRPRVE